MSNYIRSPNNYDTATLLNFSCPKSYYLIHANNNTFMLTEDKKSYTITLTIGNYDVNTLKTELQTQLNGHDYTYVVAYNRSTNKYTITVSSNPTQPYIDFRNSNTYLILGFEAQLYQFAANTLTSPNVCYLQSSTSLLLCCDFVVNNVLSQIVPNTQDLSIISYEENNPSFASHDLSRTNIIDGRFYLLDAKTQEPINLNGIDFEFSFAIYKKNTYYHSMMADQQLQIQINDLQKKLNDLTAT